MIKLWCFMLIIAASTYNAQRVEKLIYADKDVTIGWLQFGITRQLTCSVEQCTQIGQTGFHSIINCQSNETVAPKTMNEYIEFEADCTTQTADRTAAVPDMCISLDTTISIKFSTCDLTDSQFSFTYWSDVSNCSDSSFDVYNASPVCNLRNGKYVGAVCNVHEGTPSATPISEPAESAPLSSPYPTPTHITPIKSIPTPPMTNNAVETTITFGFVSCLILAL